MIDKIISHYKVIDKLGEGGMGVLYLAEDLEINRKAVLKFLPPDMIDDPDVNLRFKREAQSAGSLSHPNIVTIYDVGVYENKTFIAMEYVEGKTLREVIKSDELTIERITDISVQICEGLNEAHSKGITHRDIKPENILIDKKEKVKIVDFGLAKIKNISRGITKQGSTVGTIKYMSPEQIRNQNVDHRSDIWSFGVILYEMITGKHPFKGEYDASLFYSIINQTPEPLARYKANISEGIQRIIDKSLDKDPETRYQHIDELLSDLRREKRYSGEFTVSNLKRKNTRLIKRISIISAALISIVLIFIASNYFLNNQTKKVKPPKHTQLTYDGNIDGYYSTLAFSPDGQFIAYSVNKANEMVIYVKEVASGKSFEVFKGIIWGYHLRWSPKGTHILFSCTLKDYTNSTFVVPKFGGNAQSLIFLRLVCWSPDAKLIAGIPFSKVITFIDRETDKTLKQIKPIGDFDRFISLDWSPMGDRLSFITRKDEKHILWTIKTDGTQQQEIYKSDKELLSSRWSNDGKSIYFLHSQNNTYDLMKIKISTSDGTSNDEPSVIQTGLQTYGFSLTSNNKKMIYTKDLTYSNLWCFTFDEENKIFHSKKLTNGTSWFDSPQISPDKEKIVFTRQGNLFLMPFENGNISQLTFLKSECVNPKWSPDGEKISFLSAKKVWVISAKGGSALSSKQTNAGEFSLSWISNTKILYQPAESRNLMILDTNTGEEKLLLLSDSAGTLAKACVSPDGRKVAVLWNNNITSGGIHLWIISLEDSKQILLSMQSIVPIKWSADGKWIYGVNTTRPSEILKVSSLNGEVKLVYTLPFNTSVSDETIDITEDGKKIIYNAEDVNSDVWMIENFDPDVE